MFAERLKELRKSKRHLTQQNMADILGVAKTTYASYEQGKRTPDTDLQNTIADYFGVSLDYLHGRSDLREPSRLPSNVVVLGGVIPEDNSIPVLGRIAASAPAGLVSDYEGELFIQPSTIKRYGKKDLFALKILGDSMNRIIPDGAIAVVHRTCDWESGDICAVTINGDDATLKQVTKTDKGIKFTPLSFSKFHAPWEYIKDEDEVDVCILGTFLYGVIPTDKM